MSEALKFIEAHLHEMGFQYSGEPHTKEYNLDSEDDGSISSINVSLNDNWTTVEAFDNKVRLVVNPSDIEAAYVYMLDIANPQFFQIFDELIDGKSIRGLPRRRFKTYGHALETLADEDYRA